MLFPRDLLNPRLVDEHFRDEAAAARSIGLDVHLIDHDAIVTGDLTSGLRGIEGSGSGYVYRGWMVRPVQYSAMSDELRNRGVVLRTTGSDFRQAHHLPQWYPTMVGATPRSVWTAALTGVNSTQHWSASVPARLSSRTTASPRSTIGAKPCSFQTLKIPQQRGP